MPACVIDRPVGTGDYLLMLFYDEVWVAAAGTPARQPRNTFIIWTPGMRQYYGNREHPFNHTWIHCDGRVIASLLGSTGLPRNEPFVVPDPAVMERCLLAVHEELTRHARPDATIVRNLLENWLRDTARAIARSEEAKDEIPPPFLAVRRFIEAEYAAPIRLPDLAKQAHLSVPHFCAEFKRFFGTPAIDYLIRQRMHQAAYLLKDRNVRIKEVARRVGYEDLYYFSRLFRKHYGVSPRAFRKP
jgi:AraC family transcriptional regulator of arabinose operon